MAWRFLRLEQWTRSGRPSNRLSTHGPLLAVILGAMIFAICGLSRAEADNDGNRFAILIANGSYPDSGVPQKSAGKDAALLAGELRRDMFDVDLETDLSRDAMRTSVDAFLAKLKPGVTALLYFNGIGIQVAHQTYLIPVSAEIWSEADVKREGLSIDGVLADMNRRGASVKIVIIDASRRNPFERRFRAYSAGLAGPDAPEGTLVMYAAAPNKVGPDSTGEISLFMNELVKEFRTPNIGVEDAIMHTRVGVSRASNGEQVPWFASSLVDPVYFGHAPEGATAPQPPPEAPPPVVAVVKPPPPEAQSPVVAVVKPPPQPTPPPAPPAPKPAPPTDAAQNAPAPDVAVVKSPPPSPPPDAAQNAPPHSEPVSAPRQAAPVPFSPPKLPEPIGVTAEPAKPVEEIPGAVLRDCPDCPEMMVLAAGTFFMGSGTTPFDRPPHRVTISKPFAMARAEVTFADWQRCLDANGCKFKPDSQGFGEGEHPVINVSWTDTKDYIAWLSSKTGKIYRLPSEAEWEYAAHGGTSTTFAWGPTVGSHLANCADCGGASDPPHTVPARSFPANGFGLYDMAGNAAEWVEDCWNASYRGAPKDGSAWLTGNCEQRVLRGGSFDGSGAYVKPSARFRYDADVRYWANGFRVLREVP